MRNRDVRGRSFILYVRGEKVDTNKHQNNCASFKERIERKLEEQRKQLTEELGVDPFELFS